MEKEQQLQLFDSLIKEIQSSSRILHCQCFDQTSSVWRTNYHDHDYLELLYFIKGHAEIEGADSYTLVSTKELVIYPTGFGHREYVDFSRNQEAVCLGLVLESGFSFSEVITISDPDHLLEWLFIQLSLKFDDGQPDLAIRLKELLFFYIKECFLKNDTARQPMSYVVMNHLQHHYSEKIYQNELAELVNVSSAYLYKIFKQETGQTPMDYLNRLRIQKAMDLLDQNKLTLKEIGIKVGIQDAKYFSKLFKKYAGKSFREFRKDLNKYS